MQAERAEAIERAVNERINAAKRPDPAAVAQLEAEESARAEKTRRAEGIRRLGSASAFEKEETRRAKDVSIRNKLVADREKTRVDLQLRIEEEKATAARREKDAAENEFRPK